MVLGRNDKRKRKEGDLVDLMDPLSESPKRTKVHAQRKFAQGAATVFSPAPTLIKEKEKAKPAMITELISHKRPNTEDFLTFLCFRGTSILPPNLNFFNAGSKKEKAEAKAANSSKSNSQASTSTTVPSTNVSKVESMSNAQIKAGNKNAVTVKKKVPPEVQKTLSKFKNATSTVQALKKKYQEQRLAKQRIKNKFKASCVMRTRSSTERVVLKSVTKLTTRKFLPRNETKRHGLRSGALADRVKRGNILQTKNKTIAVKPKKKLTTKDQTSESSDSDTWSEEDTPPSRSGQPAKRPTKAIQKKICTRSKSEMRRITRSQRDSAPTAQSLSRRPSRKTKEAAAVYMEILGRKLVSPDHDNDDNLSVDSFPELPNARRTAQAENEIKAKSKQAVKAKELKEKDCKTENPANLSKPKAKIDKPILKSKRTLRVRRYCELDSEDESETSGEPDKTPVTRRSTGKIEQPTTRSLRSSSRNTIVKPQTPTPVKVTKDKKEIVKRVRPAQKKADSDESEEESLGSLLSKLKKKKEEEAENRRSLSQADSTTAEAPVEPSVDTARSNNRTPSQVSDDEESFRGFTKKAISKVLNSCNSHVNANLLASEEAYGKLDVLKTQVTPQIETWTSREPKHLTLENPAEPVNIVSAFTIVKPLQEQSTISLRDTETESTVRDESPKLEKKCNHVADNSTMNLIDMPMTGTHGRKSRVNMSTEQIEKWLNESSMAREKQRKTSDSESSSNFPFEVPEKVKSDTNHLSIPTRIQHLVRPVNVTLSKLAEKANARDRIHLQSNIASTLINAARVPIAKPLNIPTPNRNKINADIKEIIKGRSAKTTKEVSTGEESDTISKSDQNSVDGSPDKKSTPEKKGIFQQRKTFLPKVKERKTATPSANAFSPENESSVYAFESDTEVPINTPFRRKLKELSQKGGGNAPSEPDSSRTDNEDSKTVTEVIDTVSKSTKFSDVGTSSESDNKDSSSKGCSTIDTGSNKFAMPKSFGNLSNVQVLPLGKIPSEWSGVNCSASIAVQVNFDERSQEVEQQQQQQQQLQQQQQQQQQTQSQKSEDTLVQQKCTEISTQTENTNDNEDDNDGGHVFYIPLQTVTRNGPNLVQGQQLIQGVAVKLGTEGPNGPNQRVLLRAHLVTKPPLAVARCPPVGTVQPTTRTPPSTSSSTSVLDHPYAVVDSPVASTSASSASRSTIAQTTPNFQTPQQQSHRNVAGQNVSRQNSTSSTNVVAEKATKSPKATRERKASVDSAKAGKRGQAKSRQKIAEVLSPSNATTFPYPADTNAEARLVEAPTFHPTEKDFQDPLEYIDKIRPIAEKFGICRVVPPANFKPECKVSDDMRFTAYNQYVHQMLHRWGPNVKEMMAIKKYLATQSITLTHPPWIGGMEVDLPHLYQTVQSLGGLKEVIEKKKWQKVADGMKIPKSAQDRVTKLDDIYCKYLLPYDTLSPEEREKLFDEVEEEWKKRESKTLQRLDAPINDNDEEDDDDSSDEIEECIVKGRNMALNAFYRIARNTQRMWFGENQRTASEAEGASASEVENAFWKHVAERKRHVCVHAASIDSSGRGFGFSVAKNSPFARHPWNLKVLTNNAGSVLRALGPLMGVTVPTLHVGMLFSACCWYRDPHGLPWIEYLHTGAKKIWYGIPDEHNDNFRDALSKMVPRYCKKKTIWLPSDTAMVPPELLVNNGVPLCQTVQEPGQFIVVFPKAFTSSICTGYVVSESVYFAQPAWLENAEQVFKDLQDSCEPSIFSFERLLFSIINDSRSHIDVLKQIMPVVIKIRERELDYRKQLEYIGLENKEKLPLPDTGKGKKGKKVKEEDGDFECETCRANLFVSLVSNSLDDSVYCLPHGLQMIVRKKQVLKSCTLMYTYTEDELDDLIHKLEDRIEAKSKKANQIRQSK